MLLNAEGPACRICVLGRKVYYCSKIIWLRLSKYFLSAAMIFKTTTRVAIAIILELQMKFVSKLVILKSLQELSASSDGFPRPAFFDTHL